MPTTPIDVVHHHLNFAGQNVLSYGSWVLTAALIVVAVQLGRKEKGTPFYVYSSATLERHYRVFRDALASFPGLGAPLIAYAVKANSNISVLATLGRLGAGADTVSEGEIRRALGAGIPAARTSTSASGAISVRCGPPGPTVARS